MKVSEALRLRKSTRAFMPKEVEQEKIDFILNHARFSPSGVNTQPWDVAVVRGKKKELLQEKILCAFESGETAKMDYDYYPKTWFEPYKSRRKETGLSMYQTLGISREDKEAQVSQWKANYRAFDAPLMLLFFIHKDLEKGSFLDYGMFIQSIMLLAVEQGLSSCPQAALGEYPDIVREELGISEEKLLIAGLALGYEDSTAVINSFTTTRIQSDQFVQYYNE